MIRDPLTPMVPLEMWLIRGEFLFKKIIPVEVIASGDK